MKSEVREYTTEGLLNKVKTIGGYKQIPTGWWILGVEANEKGTDNMNDKFYYFLGSECKYVSTGTVNAGLWAAVNFSSYESKGVAQIKTDEWYYDVWKRGLHKGKVEALVQVGGFKVIRDNNKNNIVGDMLEWSWEYAKGLNHHANSYNLLQKTIFWAIGKWSLGCQVANNIPIFKKFLDESRPQDRFTYCLIKEF
jgi:hypothetical protein